MAGMPGETRETLQETIDLCFELKPDFITWAMLTIYPGSSLYKSIEQRYSSLCYTSSNILFEDGGVFARFEENFTEQEIQDIITRVYRSFYFRPTYLLRRLFSIRSFSEFIHYLKGGLEIIKWVWPTSNGR